MTETAGGGADYVVARQTIVPLVGSLAASTRLPLRLCRRRRAFYVTNLYEIRFLGYQRSYVFDREYVKGDSLPSTQGQEINYSCVAEVVWRPSTFMNQRTVRSTYKTVLRLDLNGKDFRVNEKPLILESFG